MSNKVRIAVIGAGVFGGYHANKCAANLGIEFVGIYDPDIMRAKAQADKHGVAAFDDVQNMLAKCDAVIVASPADTHGAMAITALEHGKHCLIEKPIAHKLEDAAKIIKTSEAKSLIVQVGHQERFVAKAIGLHEIAEKPARIISRRMSKFTERGTDVSVSLDLMTHDLDIIAMLMGQLPEQVTGKTRIEKSGFPDFSQGELSFDNSTATVTASRLEDDFTRTMDITYPSGELHIDFNAKTLIHNTPFDLNENFGEDPTAKDSLGAASAAFISAILDGTPVPVTAQDGYNALKLALAIDGEISWEKDAL